LNEGSEAVCCAGEQNI